MNITKEGEDLAKARQLEALNKVIKDNPCDGCTMKYIDESYCLTCDINFE